MAYAQATPPSVLLPLFRATGTAIFIIQKNILIAFFPREKAGKYQVFLSLPEVVMATDISNKALNVSTSRSGRPGYFLCHDFEGRAFLRTDHVLLKKISEIKYSRC